MTRLSVLLVTELITIKRYLFKVHLSYFATALIRAGITLPPHLLPQHEASSVAPRLCAIQTHTHACTRHDYAVSEMNS